jgi:hypothetical protein
MSKNYLHLDLPKEYTCVVLSNKNPDQKRLRALYSDLLSPNFPNKDHLESYENFQYYLNPPLNCFFARSHVIIIESDSVPIACLILEYYPICNCGLVSYMVVDEKYRGKRLANILTSKAKDILFLEHEIRKNDLEKHDLGTENYTLLKSYLEMNEQEQIFEILSGLPPLLFLETEKEDDVDPIMDPKVRLVVYDRMGFKKIPFDYVQPNLSDKQVPVHLYLMVSNDLAHKDQDGTFLDSNSLLVFIWEFALEVSPKFFHTQTFINMKSTIKSKKLKL